MEHGSEFHKQVLDHLAEGVYFVDTERKILYWNHAAEVLSGYSADEVVGSHCYNHILNHVNEKLEPLCTELCPLTIAIARREMIVERAFLHHKKGHRVPVNIKVNPVVNQSGKVIGAVEIFSDATPFLELEGLNRDLEKTIRIDPLTKVPNRRAFLELIQQEFQRYRRYATPFAVIFTDIDFFKEVNDRFGHKVGDLTLQWFARKLSGGLRKVDTVSRFGGEEFLMLLPSTTPEAATRAADKLRAQVALRPCPETGQTLTASFGVASVENGDTPESLIERADRGLYLSKKAGRNLVTFQGLIRPEDNTPTSAAPNP
ncbi:MAG TPA: sensor domain-containing diguanylate cyclase [Geothermobacteraceae bacterium]|nr:sensor domain-containing diguanylate cyclase [Geothermobacteraceae bacterium]